MEEVDPEDPVERQKEQVEMDSIMRDLFRAQEERRTLVGCVLLRMATYV